MDNKRIIQKIINKSNNKHIIYADIETIMMIDKEKNSKIHYPYAIGWVYDNKYSYIFTDNELEIINYSIITKFLNQISSTKQKIIYFHNMSNFDGFLILHKILKENYRVVLTERNNVLYNININNKLNIRDSKLIIPISLEKIGKFFCIKHKKLDYDIASINLDNLIEKKEEILNYLKEDVLTLQEGMETFYNLIKDEFDYDIHQSLSQSSISFNIFRLNYYDINKYPIYKNSLDIDAFLRKAFYGGRTEVYKPRLTKGFYYDVNSLYPTSMLHDLPIGTPKYIKTFHNKNIENFHGFAKVVVYAPYMHKPLLPYRTKEGRIIFPYGQWIGVYYSEEINFAKKYGYKFHYIKGYEYAKGPVLKEFSETLYNERKKYFNPELQDHPMNLILKLQMNSLFGRFGMTIFKKMKKIIPDNLEEINKYINKFKVSKLRKINKNQVYIEYVREATINKNKITNQQITEDYGVNTAIQISAAITARARIHMYNYINNKNVVYTDTDSIFTSEKLDDSLIGIELGQMKLVREIEEGFFISPKKYNYIGKNKKEYVVFAGNNEKNVDTILLNNKIYNNQQKYNWNRRTFFRKNHEDWTIKEEETKIEYKLDVYNRKKVYNENKLWIDTEPLHLNIEEDYNTDSDSDNDSDSDLII